MTEIRLIHMADIHLGYTGSVNLVFGEGDTHAGRYVREVDIEQAVKRMSKVIRSSQPHPDVVVIAGDLFHRSAPLPRAIDWAARFVRLLTQHSIEVVIIEGNHETPSWRQTGNPTAYLAELGAHVVYGWECEVIQGEQWRHPFLREHLAVHALPYRAVLQSQFVGIRPVPGKLNVLLSHGRVQGMEEANTLGLATKHIPTEVVRRGWDYVALGDCHFHRHQPVQDAPAYYAGSLEALNFGEAADIPPRDGDPNAVRGVVDVRLAPAARARVYTIENTERRPILRLRPIDAADLAPEGVTEMLHKRIGAHLPSEALVLLEVQECPEEVYQRLDHAQIDALRRYVRRCDIRFSVVHPSAGLLDGVASQASVDEQWETFVGEQIVNDGERAWYLAEGRARIEVARQQFAAVQLRAATE